MSPSANFSNESQQKFPANNIWKKYGEMCDKKYAKDYDFQKIAHGWIFWLKNKKISRRKKIKTRRVFKTKKRFKKYQWLKIFEFFSAYLHKK